MRLGEEELYTCPLACRHVTKRSALGLAYALPSWKAMEWYIVHKRERSASFGRATGEAARFYACATPLASVFSLANLLCRRSVLPC